MAHRAIPHVGDLHQQEAIASAREAGLRYVHDDGPGIRRLKVGGHFRHVGPDGRAVSPADLARIKSLALPPAWRNVWICPIENGHLQAVGFDGRGRKQYRYHPKWREVRDEHKFGRMAAFVRALPRIRRRVGRDLKLSGMPKEKAVAAVVRLLETTLIRVGNEEYAKQNKSFGLTTMYNEHAKVRGADVHFEFRGKSGVEHAIDLHDARLAKIIRQCQELPGHELFAYADEAGAAHDVGSGDVNEYLQAVTGQPFTAKDFRTWAGTVLAAEALAAFEQVDSQAKRKKQVVQAVEAVARRLGNTKAVCRKCYIHPGVLDSYMDGTLREGLAQKASAEVAKSLSHLPATEAAVLVLLEQKLMKPAKPSRAGTMRRAG